MGTHHPPLSVRVWGEFACFTRPENKVERVSYSVMTPSAARGILESIFWKPEFAWQVQEIQVLNPIRHFSILRNEVNSRASGRAARSWEKNGGGFIASGDRAQRHTLGLRDVDYVIQADVSLHAHTNADAAKYRDQFRRRVKSGRCFSRPYFGCREFVANFCEPAATDKPIDLTDDLGRMLYDIQYDANKTGRGVPFFFHARLEDGVLRIPTKEDAYAASKAD